MKYCYEECVCMRACVCVLSRLDAAAKSFRLCPTLCNPIDGSPPGSHIPGILQARTLEWVAISFSNAWITIRLHCFNWIQTTLWALPVPNQKFHGSIFPLPRSSLLPCPKHTHICWQLFQKWQHFTSRMLDTIKTCYMWWKTEKKSSSCITKLLFRKLRSWHLVPSLHGK